ncbi:MAG: peptidylprolyl isomerase [Acidobacteriota bacterium]|jgi:parvulin-like peptidyl-prolyl isomerase|nr:peptidylprolyl isomerase [Acidobacteriota bacterium]
MMREVIIVKYLIRVASAVLLSLCFSHMAGAAQTAATAASPGGMFQDVVARVNDKPVSGRDLEMVIRRELAAMGSPEWRDLRVEYRSELIYAGVTSLINSRLLYEKAVASGAKATAEEVEAEVQSLAKNYSSDAEMNAALARQFLDRNSLKQRLEQDLTVAKHLNSLTQAITVAPEEISKYYAENPEMFAHPDLVRASHILLLSETSPELDAQVKERAEGLLARAKKGDDFAVLAKENSVDSTASQGGDIGYVAKDVLDPDFADTVFSMTKGEVRLIKSRHGYHVIKLTDKKLEGVAALDDIREDLTTHLKQEKAQAELANLIMQLQKDAKIEILISPGE